VGSFEEEEARIPTFVVTELGRRLLSEPDYSLNLGIRRGWRSERVPGS
jgi:hypothetical protein